MGYTIILTDILIKFRKFARHPSYYLIRFYFRNLKPLYYPLIKDNYGKRISSWSCGKSQRIPAQKIDFLRDIEMVTVLKPLKRMEDMSLDLYETLILNLFASRLVDGAKVIEIGTFEGNTTINLSINLKATSKVYSVDLPEVFIPYAFPVSINENNDLKLLSNSYSQITDHSSRNIVLVKQDSTTIDFRKVFGVVDLCFIDGNHSSEYVQSDTLNCYEILKPGGLIIWHDYGYIFSVTKFIDEWAENNKVQVQVVEGTRLAFAFK